MDKPSGFEDSDWIERGREGAAKRSNNPTGHDGSTVDPFGFIVGSSVITLVVSLYFTCRIDNGVKGQLCQRLMTQVQFYL